MNCWPIQFFADPMTQEGRNIAVLVHDGDKSHSVFMGDERPRMKPGSAKRGNDDAVSQSPSLRGTLVAEGYDSVIRSGTNNDRTIFAQSESDSRYFCRAFGFDDSHGWIYSEWREWFDVMLRESRGHGEIQRELDTLVASGQRFMAGDMFEVPGKMQHSLEEIAWALFDELVTVPRLPTPSNFAERFDHVLSVSELKFRSNVHQDVELEILASPQPLRIRFQAFFEGATSGGIKALRFRGAADANVAAQVNDILLTFGACIDHGILDKAQCVVVHDRASKLRTKYLERLQAVAILIPIFSEDAPSRLAAIFGDQSGFR